MKKMRNKILYLILALSCNFLSNSQNITDSLIEQYKKINIEKDPQTALNLINQIYLYTNQNSPLVSLEYLARAIKISDNILKDTSKRYYWLEKLAYSYLFIGKYDQAMRYFVTNKNYYEKTKDSLNYAFSLYNMGKLYQSLEVSKLASEQYKEAKKIFERINSIEGITLCNIEIASLYSAEYQSDSAFIILYSTLKSVLGNKKLEAKVMNRLGEIYFSSNINVDSALFFYKKAIDLYKKLDNITELGNCYITISSILIELQKYEEAKSYLENALKIFEKYQYKQKISQIFNFYGILNLEQKNYKQAEINFLKSLEISNGDDFYKEQKLVAYKNLSEIYEIFGNLKKSNEYLKLYNETQEMFFQQKAKTGFAEIILTFQNEDKLKKIELLKKESNLQEQKLKNQRVQVFASALISLLMILLGLVLFYYLRKQKNINKILQEQNHQIYLQKKEIESQSKILEKATRDLLRQKDELQEKTHKLTSSITYASRIQKAMLPREEVFKKYFDDYMIFYKPKETVSGDFYWISEIKSTKPSLFVDDEYDTKVLVAVVDCTGHGVPGAFMSMLGEAFLNQIVNILKIYETDKILYELHKSIRKALQQEETENNDGMDLAICMVDKKQRIIEFSGAKNPIVYIQNDKIYKINGSLLPVGGLQKEKVRIFEKSTIDVTAETYVYMFSDGFQDQFGGQYGRKYMAEPFRNLLYKNYKLPGQQQVIAIYNELESWKGKKYSQMDDITIIGFKI